MLMRRIACFLGGCLAGAGFGWLVNAFLTSISQWLLQGTNLIGNGYQFSASSGIVWASTFLGAGVGLVIAAALRDHPGPGRVRGTTKNTLR